MHAHIIITITRVSPPSRCAAKSMSPSRCLLFAAFIASATAADAAAATTTQKPEHGALPKHACLNELLHAFTLLDANADGMLSREEINLAISTSHPNGSAPPSEADAPEAPDVKLQAQLMTTVLQENFRLKQENERAIEHMQSGRMCQTADGHAHAHGHEATHQAH